MNPEGGDGVKKAELMKKTAGRCVLFAGIDPEKAADLMQRKGYAQRFERGEVIYSPGNYRKSLGIILSGRAVVEKENGVLLNLLSAGECFGAAALFNDEQRYLTTVRAKTSCEVLFLTMESMQEMLMQDPQIALNYIRFLSGRIQFLNRKIDSFTAQGAGEALLSYLRQQPNQTSEGVPMAKLAEILNIGRTSLYRAAQQLEDCGKIKREGRHIELLSGNISQEKQDEPDALLLSGQK